MMIDILRTIDDVNNEETILDLTGKKGPKAILSKKSRRDEVKVEFNGAVVPLKVYLASVNIEAKKALGGYPSDRVVIYVSDSACGSLIWRQKGLKAVVV